MGKKNRNHHIAKAPSWSGVGKSMRQWGWYTTETKNKIVFQRGRQRIEAKRIPATNEWKVEYFSGYIMDDSTGMTNQDNAKRLAMEMGVLK